MKLNLDKVMYLTTNPLRENTRFVDSLRMDGIEALYSVLTCDCAVS